MYVCTNIEKCTRVEYVCTDQEYVRMKYVWACTNQEYTCAKQDIYKASNTVEHDHRQSLTLLFAVHCKIPHLFLCVCYN